VLAQHTLRAGYRLRFDRHQVGQAGPG